MTNTATNHRRARLLTNGLIGLVFTLPSRPTLKFRVTHTYTAVGSIACLTGETLDGAQQTSARVADVVFEN